MSNPSHITAGARLRAGASRHAPVVVLALLGAALSVTLFLRARAQERDRTRDEFSRAATRCEMALRDGLDANLSELQNVAAFYRASHLVERQEFRAFVTPFLAARPGIQALEWIPRVADLERAAWEEAARRDGFTDFQFTERRVQGRMVRAGRRREYFPVYFVEPYAGNEIALGFDLASNPVRREALYQARDTGRMTASARITLVQETGDQFGFLVFSPIYHNGAPVESVADRRRSFEGLALGVFRIGDILQRALSRARPEHIDVHVFDESAPESERFLAFHASRTAPAARDPLTAAQAHACKGLHHAATITVAGRKWWILCTPTPAYIAARTSWEPWVVLAAGLLVTAVIAAYLSLALTSAARARRSADELARGKQALEAEIAERKRMERDLEAKNLELESFVYTVSHDLRAPLISMEGFAKLLADEYGGRLDDEGRDYLRRVRANVEAMNSLLMDLLELSRVGRVQEPVEAVAVGEVVAEVLEDLATMVSKSAAEVTVAAGLPTVQCSRGRVVQVFSNLISNAIKFSRDGEPPRVEIGWRATERAYHFLVKDNGIGIEPSQQHKVFEIFSRLGEKRVEGTGVGLAIVKRIVEDHGGEVGVDSAPGQGSTFWFTCPAAPVPGKEKRDAQLNGAGHHSAGGGQ